MSINEEGACDASVTVLHRMAEAIYTSLSVMEHADMAPAYITRYARTPLFNLLEEAQVACAASLSQVCYALYQTKGGESMVHEFVEQVYPGLAWFFCRECESKQPTDDGTCLVCDSPIEEA